MYDVDKKYIYGYAMLPCFTCRILVGAQGAELTCSPFLQKIFEVFFAPFWSGTIHL